MLHVEDLACLRGDRLLFRHLHLDLQAGELLRVRGANGVGKTSLLRLLCGLATPETGDITWRGQSIRRHREEFHAELLYLGHAPAINDLLSPLENLRFACALAGDVASEADCSAALKRIGLARQLDLPAKVLSQGQRRRVLLARLFLAGQRPLWILDEPFTALDAAAVEDLAGVLAAHAERGGMVVFTSHQDANFSRTPRILDVSGFAA
jgi:heme exporter protein A